MATGRRSLVLAVLVLGCTPPHPATQLHVRDDRPYDAAACAETALRNGVRDDRAAQSFAAGCRRGDPAACSLLAVLHEGAPKGLELEAWLLLRSSCAAGYPRACANLGSLYETAPEHTDRAAELYSYACSRGVPEACDSLATLYERGTGGEASFHRVWQLSFTACLLRQPASCMRLGRLHEQRGELAVASTWYRKGCQYGDMTGCLALDRVYASQAAAKQ